MVETDRTNTKPEDNNTFKQSLSHDENDIENREGNAFVVTRVGQIRNVHTLIKQKNLEHNVLVIMVTERDESLLINMQKAYIESLFDEVIFFTLPAFPLRLNRKKSAIIYTGFENILIRLNDEFSIKELYLCNIDNYYVYFERIIAEHNFNIKINLLEEGLTTYKITSGESLEKAENSPNINDLKKAAREFVEALKDIIKKTGILVLQCIGFVVRKPLVSYVHNLWVRLTVPEKQKFGKICNFNKAYVCLPDLVEDSVLNFTSVEKLSFQFTRVEDEAVLDTVKGYSTIFVNQKYVNYNSHFAILFRIFREMGIDSVMIKLHPKENVRLVTQRIENLKIEYPEIDVKILSSIGQIPVEDLVYSCDIDRVIGLTSSALIYIQSGLENVEVVSIAERYRELCGSSDSGVASRELVQFDDEYRFFKKFDNIVQFVPDECVEDTLLQEEQL